MNWYKFSFTAEEVTNNAHGKAQEEFMTFFTTLRGPRDLALFSAWEPKADILSLFICTSAAHEPILEIFLSKYNASPISKPQGYDRIALLAGHADAHDLLK